MAHATNIRRIYALRTCNNDLTSHGGFQWPESGRCEAPDWSPKAECGNGLHGLLNGEGGGNYLDWSPDAKWLVCDITEAHDAGLVVEIGAKIKFPYCDVVHVGDQRSATQFLLDVGCAGAIVGAFLTAGDSGTATAGDWGTATAGDWGMVQVKWWDGERYRICTGYVGEDGIEANTAYCVRDGKLVEAGK